MKRLPYLLGLRDELDALIAAERAYLNGIEHLQTRVGKAGRKLVADYGGDWANQVIGHVAVAYGVTPDDITGKARHARYIEPRAVAAWLMRAHGLPLTRIGTHLNRDHSTVIHAVRNVDARPEWLRSAHVIRERMRAIGDAE